MIKVIAMKNQCGKLAVCRIACATLIGLGFFASEVQAQAAASGVMVYPAQGQSARQQDRDKYECYDWARGQTGFAPAQASQASQGTPQNQSRSPSGGMLKGAVGGAAVGELAHHDAGRGAAIGVMGAAMRERAREKQESQARQQQAAQQQAARGQQRANYYRAFGACMEGRGYSVK